MLLEQRLTQTQKLILTQAMQQSLHCLQMTALELRSYLQELSLSNPLLDVDEQPLGDLRPEVIEPETREQDNVPIERREQMIWESSRSFNDESSDFTACLTRPQSFTDYLNDQLGQLALLDPATLTLCRYLVGCLNSAGYLDVPLWDLAEDLSVPLFDMEQALFVVQALDPPGVGARSLSECLLLQLAQDKEFTAVNIALIQRGLPLLAENDFAGLSKLLDIRPAEVRRAAEIIRSLNPIPSRGFASERSVSFILPEATILRSGGRLIIEMNDSAMPRVSLSKDYCAMLGQPEYQEAQPYLKEKLSEARSLMNNLSNRHDTMFRLLSAVVDIQRGYFLSDQGLLPMTMRQLSDELGLNVSTISRAVKDKYIQFNGRVFPLRSLFTASLQSTDGQAVSAEAARQQIRRFIQAENPARPLSDEALGEALSGVGIVLSRRTVAKYRSEMGIPTASARKRAGK